MESDCTDTWVAIPAQDDMDCPLCLEEMDISDLNFKPCPCGYQVGLLLDHTGDESSVCLLTLHSLCV